MVAFFASCKQEVNLYADYRELPIIYGLLDASLDTNYIKITRAFYTLGDATQVALNPDSSNYPGRLDVRLAEYCNGRFVREIILDTITIHNKQEGIFYAPAQKLYYTAEALQPNYKDYKYSYILSIALPDSTMHCKTDIVGSRAFKVKSLGVNFSHEYFGTHRPFYFYPAVNAYYYDIEFKFSFKERRTPDSDSVLRSMSWKVSEHEDYWFATHMSEDAYSFTYRPETFWMVLKEYLGDDTLTEGVVRYLSDYPVQVTVTACGKNLRQYMYFNDPVNGIAPGDPEFSLIQGGYGVFSSRMVMRRKLRLGGETVPELLKNKYYGFSFMGGDWKDESVEP